MDAPKTVGELNQWLCFRFVVLEFTRLYVEFPLPNNEYIRRVAISCGFICADEATGCTWIRESLERVREGSVLLLRRPFEWRPVQEPAGYGSITARLVFWEEQHNDKLIYARPDGSRLYVVEG